MSLPKSLLFNHSCVYAKRGGVAAYHVVWIGLCLRSVPGVRVLASAVDDSDCSYYVHGTNAFIKDEYLINKRRNFLSNFQNALWPVA